MATAADGWVTSRTGLFATRVVDRSGVPFLCTAAQEPLVGFVVAMRDGDEFTVEVRPVSRDQYPELMFLLLVDGRKPGKRYYSAKHSVMRWEGFYENNLFSTVRPFVASSGSVQQEEVGEGTPYVGTIVVVARQSRLARTTTLTDDDARENKIGEDGVVPNNESKKFFELASLSTKAGAARSANTRSRKVGDVHEQHKGFGPVLDAVPFAYDQESHLRLRGLQFPGNDAKRPSPTQNEGDEPVEKKPKVEIPHPGT